MWRGEHSPIGARKLSPSDKARGSLGFPLPPSLWQVGIQLRTGWYLRRSFDPQGFPSEINLLLVSPTRIRAPRR